MSFLVDQHDDACALWVTECPADCVSLSMIASDDAISIALHMRGQCLPNWWQRLRFSLGVIGHKWRQASHPLDFVVWDHALPHAAAWLNAHLPTQRPDEALSSCVWVDVDGPLQVSFEVCRSDQAAYDLVLLLPPLTEDPHCSIGLFFSGGRGRWRLAWDSIFRRWYVEEWFFAELGRADVEGVIGWLDFAETPRPADVALPMEED